MRDGEISALVIVTEVVTAAIGEDAHFTLPSAMCQSAGAVLLWLAEHVTLASLLRSDG